MYVVLWGDRYITRTKMSSYEARDKESRTYYRNLTPSDVRRVNRIEAKRRQLTKDLQSLLVDAWDRAQPLDS